MSFFPSSVPTALQLLDARNNKSVVLTSGINDVVTTIPVADTSDIPTAGYLTFEDGSNEVIQYTGVTPTSLTGVTRGADGSTASSHSNSGAIGMWGNAAYHTLLRDEVIAIAQNLSSRIGLSATQLLTPVGSAAAPVYSFASDPNTGIYSYSADAIGFALGGAEYARLTASQVRTQMDIFAYVAKSSAELVVAASNRSTTSDGATYGRVYAEHNNGTYSANISIVGFMDGSSNRNCELWMTGVPVLEGDAPGAAAELSLKINVFNGGSITAMNIPKTGEVQFQLGSASLPSISFQGDVDTGIYRVSANHLGITSNTVLQMDFGGGYVTAGSGVVCAFDDGSAANPGFAFALDLNTGFYRIGADQIGVACGGVNVATFNSSGLVASMNFANGSAAAPSITFAGDPDTGLYSAGGNFLRFASNGVLNGYCGGGWFYWSDGAASTPAYSFMNDVDTGLFLAGANAIGFAAGASTRMTVESTGTYHSVDLLFNSSTYNIGSATFYPGRIFVGGGSAASPSFTFQSDTDTGIYRAGTNSLGISSGGNMNITIDDVAGITVNNNILCNSAAGYNIGSATLYWNEINYKTLTDRGCLPWCDDGVELIDGSKVSDLDAICAIKKHPTHKTVHGLPKLDYRTFPKKAYRPADSKGELFERDADGEPVEGQDGIEMTMMFGVMLGAFKQLKAENDSLKQRLEILEA